MPALKFAAVALGLGFSAVLSPFFPLASADSSVSENREDFLGRLTLGSTSDAAQTDAELLALLKSFRFPPANSRAPRSLPTVSDAPYVAFILGQKLPDVYAAAYDSSHAEQYEKYVNHPELELIFDEFLNAYLTNSLPDSLAGSARQLGSCLANKAVRGKFPGCTLDPSDKVYKPSKLKLAFLKFTCWTPFQRPCHVRRMVYAAAKADLIRARDTQALKEPFEAAFPARFREMFLTTLAEKKAALAQLVSQKFGNPEKQAVSPLWQSSLLEGDPRTGAMSLRDFATGLQSDVRAAARWSTSPNPELRAHSAALFYAAANRLLLLTGGQEAVWDGLQFKVADGDRLDPASPKKAPMLALQRMGGWAGRADGGFDPWDWATYDPAAHLRIFPTAFTLGARGTPQAMPAAGTEGAAWEDSGDLAALVDGVTAFLELTRPGAPLASYFGDAADLGKILEPASPVLFPREGRQLGVGVLSGILRNLIDGARGHIEVTLPGSGGAGGVGLVFHDRTNAAGRSAEATVRSTSELLSAADRLREVLAAGGDGDLPAEFLNFLPALDGAIQAGALSLIAWGQGENGMFGEKLQLPAGVNPNFQSQVAGMRALTAAYDASQVLVLRLALESAWKAMDAYWTEKFEAPGAVPLASEIWPLVGLWQESQSKVRADIGAAVDWAKWEARIATLRK